MNTTSDDVAWMNLANHLAGFVHTDKKNILQVYAGVVPSFGPAACLRVWIMQKTPIKGPDGETIDEDDSFLKATIALAPDVAFCTDHEKGIREIELCNPRACELILEWMIYVGLAHKGVKWRDPA